MLCGALIAQTEIFSTIRGTATDESGGALPGVTIKLVQLETNVERTFTTGDTGDYEIPQLRPGTYRLTATLPGFKTLVADQIIVDSSQIRRLDLPMKVGGADTEVTVEGNAAVISQEGATITGSLTSKQYTEIPMVAQFFDPNLVMSTLAGVVAPIGGSYSMQFNGQNSSQLQAGEDGVTEDTPVTQTNNMEVVDEMVVVTNSGSAEYSRAASFNLVTKAGSNELHGRLTYGNVNDAMNARAFFDPVREKYRIHTLGAQAGGPIIKDKTFFYGAWNGLRVPSHDFRFAVVPTEKMRAGDFSSLIPEGINLVDPLTGAPFPGNIIPAGRINQTSQKIQDLYIPKPNMGTNPDSLVNNFGWTHPKPDDLPRYDHYSMRVDHNFSSNNILTGRLFEQYTPYYLSGPLPNFAWTRNRHHHNFVLVDTHTFSPTFLNTVRFGWIKDHVEDGKENYGYKPPNGEEAVNAIGLQGVNPKGYEVMGFPNQSIEGFTSLAQQPGGILQDDRNLLYSDSATWARGSHVLKFGGEVKTYRSYSTTAPAGTYGSFSFSGDLSGFSYADFLLGLPTTSFRIDPLTNRTRISKEIGTFVTDTFKVNQQLTLDLGLRWDYFTTPRFEDGLMFNWDPASGNVIVPQAARNSISPLYPTTINVVTGDILASPRKTNFRPRIGVAYRVKNNTVIRGGYGIYTEALGRFARIQGTGPFQLGETFNNVITNGTPLFQYPNPFPAGALGAVASQSVSGYPLDTNNGDIHQFNVSVEREIFNIGTRISYIGARDRGLNYSLNINKPQPSTIPFSQDRRPFPQFVGTTVTRDNGELNYNALQIETQRKVGAVTFDIHYTWAKNMLNYLNLENPYSPLHWAEDSPTPHHRMVFNAGWQLPVGQGRRFLDRGGVVNQVLGGWQLYYVGFLQTGQRFSPSFSGSDPSNTRTVGGLPDRVADGNLPPGDRHIEKWFDTSAFVVPTTPGRFGNSAPNVLEGPGYNAHHLSVGKHFRMSERFDLEYTAQVSNIFNHPNFYFPFSNVSIPDQAGQVYTDVSHWDVQKGGPRWIEMKLRLTF